MSKLSNKQNANKKSMMARMDYVATHAYSGNANWDMQSINTIYQRSAMVIIVIVMVIIVIIIIGTCKESTTGCL